MTINDKLDEQPDNVEYWEWHWHQVATGVKQGQRTTALHMSALIDPDGVEIPIVELWRGAASLAPRAGRIGRQVLGAMLQQIVYEVADVGRLSHTLLLDLALHIKHGGRCP